MPRHVLAASLVLCALLAACGGTSIEQSTPAGISTTGISLPGRLLFVRGGNLWNWQGSAATQFTQRGDLTQPAWSPDGTRIASVVQGASYSDIVLLPAAGGEPLRLTDGDSTAPPNSFERAHSTIWSRYPAFMPDGAQVLFAAQAGPAAGEPASDFNMTLYQAKTTVGSERTQIYASDTGQVGRVAVSSTGTIVFALAPTNSDAPLLMRYADGNAQVITGVPEQSYDPAFSADGAWLAFAARNAGATDVFTLAVGGGTATRLTTLGSTRSPAFSPDGAWLAFLALTPGTSSFDLWVAPLTTSGSSMKAGAAQALTNGLHLDPDSGLSWGK